MNIGVVCTVMHDHITTADGREFSSFGGILYNLMALDAVVLEGTRIIPLGFVGAEHRAELDRTIFAEHPRIATDSLTTSPTGTDTNVLRYVTTSSRREVMTVRNESLGPRELARAAECDAILINLVSGHELSLEALRHLRTLCKGPIYFDIHNLGKLRKDGVPVKGHRFNDWPAYFSLVDMVQANEWEAERLMGFHPETEEQYQEVALRFLRDGGVRLAVVTLGPQGCAMAWRDEAGAERFARIPAAEGINIVDTTGCGDSFSAAFLVETLAGASPLQAALLGSTLSSLNCEHRGLEGLARLRNVRERVAELYGPLAERISSGWAGDLVTP